MRKQTQMNGNGKRWRGVSVLLAFLAIGVNATADSMDSQDATAIKNLFRELVAARNRQSVEGALSFYSDECTLMSPDGRFFEGQNAIGDFFAEQHRNSWRNGARFESTIRNIHFVRRDVAVVDVQGRMIDFYLPDGKRMPNPVPVNMTVVVTKSQGQWRLSHTRGSLAPQRPQ